MSPGSLTSCEGGRTDLSFLPFCLTSAVQQIGDRIILGLIFALSSPPFIQSPAAGGEVQPHLEQAVGVLALLLFQFMILWCGELS